MNTNPASFQQPVTDKDAPMPSAAKAHHRKEQASCGDIGRIHSGANGEQVGPSYSDPHGTVFIDRESHAGAWERFLKDVCLSGHGDSNAE